MNEAEVIRRAVNGDARAWEELYVYLDSPIRLVFRRGRISRTDEDDLVQETWIRLLRALPAWLPVAPLKVFAMQASRWVLADFRRHSKKTRHEVPLENLDTARIPPATVTADQSVSLLILQECVAQASPICQKVLNLVLAQQGPEKIAEILNKSVNAARIFQTRCRKCLIECVMGRTRQGKEVQIIGGGA